MNVRTPDQILKDAFNEERTLLVCGKHQYSGPGSGQPPVFDCPDCAYVTIYTILARQKGDRQVNLDNLETIIQSMCELDAEGLFDYKSERPLIQYTPDAE